jgi:hypothetical protein
VDEPWGSPSSASLAIPVPKRQGELVDLWKPGDAAKRTRPSTRWTGWPNHLTVEPRQSAITSRWVTLSVCYGVMVDRGFQPHLHVLFIVRTDALGSRWFDDLVLRSYWRPRLPSSNLSLQCAKISKDGSMLESLKQLAGGAIRLPNHNKTRPDRNRLAPRFERFKAVA